ncbi:MAG: hypothetical protein H7X80_02620 [bacterium]|nr:hypothetical protein [Candidatus Kapabacteria bacterium]
MPVEAGEVIGSLTGGTGGIEARVSIAPAKHVVVAATGSYIHIPGKDSYIKHRYGELALGWSDTSGRAFYSFMGGAGMGYTATPPGSHLPWDNVTFDSARYVRVFAQAILGSLDHPRSIRDGERANTGFALGMRFAWVRASELWIDDQLLPPAGDFFIEPLIAWQHMGESFGTVVDLALAFNPAGGLQFHHSPIRIGVSLVYSLR